MANINATKYARFRGYHCPGCYEDPGYIPNDGLMGDEGCGCGSFGMRDIFITYWDTDGEVRTTKMAMALTPELAEMEAQW